MYARFTTFKGTPESIEQAVAEYREQALPWMRDATGFRGLIVLLDRERGESIGLTFWTTRRRCGTTSPAARRSATRSPRRPERRCRTSGAFEVLAVEALDL